MTTDTRYSEDTSENEAAASTPLLEIKDLRVDFHSRGRDVPAVRGVGLTVYPAQTVAIVGESGSGKSTTAAAVLGLLPGNGAVTGGQILFDGKDLAHASRREFEKVRGSGIGLVPQDPNTNLDWCGESASRSARRSWPTVRPPAARPALAQSKCSVRQAYAIPRSAPRSIRTSSPAV